MEQREITIQGEKFNVTTPYVAGHAITESEANALNQVRCENIRNNVATKLRKLQAGEEGAMTMEEIVAFANDYDQKYDFTQSRGTGRAAMSPVEREARRLARTALGAALKKAGKKRRDYTDEEYEKLVSSVAERDDIQKEAKKAVKAQEAFEIEL